MNYSLIIQYLQDKGYDVSLTCIAHADAIHVKFYVNEMVISLFHFMIEDKMHESPRFWLKDPKNYHRLAHTQVLKDIDNIEDNDFAAICVNVPDSTSINYKCPELVFEESLRRHIELVSRELTDLEWNESELVREFLPNWYHIFKVGDPSVLLVSDSNELQEAGLFFSSKKQNIGLSSKVFAVASRSTSNSQFSYICSQLKKRKNDNNQIAYIIPLAKLPSAPWSLDSLGEWYIELIESLELDIKEQFFRIVTQKRGKTFWLIFNGQTPSGLTWFGIRFTNNTAGKKTIPLTIEKLVNWKLTPVDVIPFTKDRLMPRSGANQKLQDKKVLLVGCGSVGSEIADKLGAAGVGKLVLSDPDVFSADNIHRHILSLDYSNFYKTTGLKYHLENKYPWMSVTSFIGKLRDWFKSELLTGFDIIIVAIGSPTAERIFHDYIYDNKVSTPVINCWVEGYGVGGHATLDIFDSQGCLRCAYIDNTDCAHGLASNLNFIQPNQDVTKNLAGCGSAFLPYGYMASTQTALITADLAVKYLIGDINRSVKVSWKGSATEALNNGINLTDRYYAFNESLEMTPLYNNICDICNE